MIGSAVSEPAAVRVAHARGALEEAAVEVEDVTGVRLAAGRPAEQQGHLAVGPGVLGQVVVDAQRVLDEPPADLDAGLHDLLAHRHAAVGGEVLEGGRVLGAGDDDDRVLHRAVLLERRNGLRHCGQLLPDRDVDADEVAALLVDDRVEGDGRLAGLAVADDQLALAAADRDQRVHGLDAGLDRRVDTLAGDDARGDALDGAGPGGLDLALAVQRAAQRVHDAAQERLAHRDLDDAARGPDLVALLDGVGVAQDDRADRLLLEVEGHAHHPAGELEQLGRQGGVQAVDLRDAVTDLHDGPDAAGLRAAVEVGDLALDDADDLV